MRVPMRSMTMALRSASMKLPPSSSVATRLPPAVAVVTFRSRRWTSVGTMKPRACLPSLAEVASEHSRSKAAARCAAASPGLARALMARIIE